MHLLFGPLIFAFLLKKQAGNARVTVAAVGMTWFFNNRYLQYFHCNPNVMIFLFEWVGISYFLTGSS